MLSSFLRKISIATVCLLSALLVSCVLMPTCGLAQEPVLRVAFHEHPPWSVLDEKGQPSGIDIEFLRLFAKRLGVSLEFHMLPFSRSLKMAELGEIDVMVGVLKRPERERDLFFIEPAYKNYSDKAFFVLKGNEHLIRSHADLTTLSLGTILGVKYYPELDRDMRIRKYPVGQVELNFKMLQAGRIDAFVMTEAAGEYWVNRLGLTRQVVKAEYVYRKRQDVHMILSKRSVFAYRVDEFTQLMKEFVKASVFADIKQRFYKGVPHQ